MSLEIRSGLIDETMLERGLSLQIGEGGLPLLYGRRGMVLHGRKIRRVNPNQFLSGPDSLVVRHQDRRDEAAHVGGDFGDVAPYIGVIGAFHESANRPPAGPEYDRSDEQHKPARREEHMLARQR